MASDALAMSRLLKSLDHKVSLGHDYFVMNDPKTHFLGGSEPISGFKLHFLGTTYIHKLVQRTL